MAQGAHRLDGLTHPMQDHREVVMRLGEVGGALDHRAQPALRRHVVPAERELRGAPHGRDEVASLGGDIVVQPFSTLLMQFAEELNANVIIRGLRAVADFEYEFQMTAMNQRLNQDIETVFLMADPRHQAIASRLVKEIAKLNGDVTPFVPPLVKTRLLEKFA